jgi:hypothetical protein
MLSMKEYKHQHYLSHKGIGCYSLERQHQCYLAHKDENKEYKKRRDNVYKAKIKLEVLTYYSNGTPKCAQCGIKDVDVLCIDHINGGGHQEGGISLRCWLKRTNYPKGFQVLCANCNLKKEIVKKRGSG